MIPLSHCVYANRPVGFAINPASDLGPRIFSSMVGYGTQVYTFRQCVCASVFTSFLTPSLFSQYWLWGPVLATITGAQVGTMFSCSVAMRVLSITCKCASTARAQANFQVHNFLGVSEKISFPRCVDGRMPTWLAEASGPAGMV